MHLFKKMCTWLALCLLLLVIPAGQAETKVVPGDIITFGTYEQDGADSFGKEDVLWVVLDVDEERAMLLSLYVLDCQPYHTGSAQATWETCSLRAWMNDTMLNELFLPEEQEAILLTHVDNSISQGNPEWATPSGNDTQDRLYLLSYQEVLHYLGANENVLAVATMQARYNGVFNCKGYTDQVVFLGAWWLRSPGYNQRMAARIGCYGAVDGCIEISNKYYGVRPVMWVDLKALP